MKDIEFGNVDISAVEKSGAPVKHHWIRQMEIGNSYPIPKDVKITSMRCYCSTFGKQSGKKFMVSEKLDLIVRIA